MGRIVVPKYAKLRKVCAADLSGVRKPLAVLRKLWAAMVKGAVQDGPLCACR